MVLDLMSTLGRLVIHNTTSHLFDLDCDMTSKFLLSESGLKWHKSLDVPEVSAFNLHCQKTHGLVCCVLYPDLKLDMVSHTPQKSITHGSVYWVP
jgi:hypothetical protein